MILQERLQLAFQQLGWVRVPDVLHQHAEEASKQNISYLEFLDKLLQEEILAKNDRYIRTRTRLARLPYHKTLSQFEFSFQPSIDERRIRDFATLQFIEHQENIVLLGPPGVGKRSSPYLCVKLPSVRMPPSVPRRGRRREHTPCTPSLAVWQAQQGIAGFFKSVFHSACQG